jgi:zinc D-Ala-D-Ala dipeptidase
LYGCLKKAYLQPDIAQRLVHCQSWLSEQRPGYRLIVYDAARPQQIQKIMWDSLHLPLHEKVKFLSNPAFGSLHNFGAAVDVSIVDDKGFVLDMGAPFDHIGEEAHPVMEWQMLQSGKLTPLHIENRNLLRTVMRKGGFWGIQTEWWHFNAMTREVAAAKYTLIR